MSAPDTVDLLISGKEVLSAKEYDVQISYFTTPSAFSMTVGSGRSTLDLAREVAPGSLFALRINGVVQFVGFIDGFERIGGGATEIALTGRDIMAQLVRDHIEHERSFSRATFEDLARAAILGAGIAEPTLFFDQAAQRAAVTGTPIVETVKKQRVFTSGPVGESGTSLEIVPLTSDGSAYDVDTVRQGVTTVSTTIQESINRVTGYKAEKPIKWDAGDTWFSAWKKDGDRAGIFLRAGVDPQGRDPAVFLLGAPDGAQRPKIWLLNTRRENTPENAVLVVPTGTRYLMTTRASEYVVLGQAGGGKDGRKAIVGRFLDEEALQGLPFPVKEVHKDPQAKNARQANFRARKRCAEARRANRSFGYRILGRHTAPMIDNPLARCIPVPDIVAHLQDDEIGANGSMWLASVRHHGSSTGGTFTDLTLIDPTDLVFGEDELTEAVPSRTVKHRRSK
jgi:hypothetical protein